MASAPARAVMPLMRNAVTFRRCQVARSSRTTTATLVSKSITAMAPNPAGPQTGGLERCCALSARDGARVAPGRDADGAPERARQVRLVGEPAGRRDGRRRAAAGQQRPRAGDAQVGLERVRRQPGLRAEAPYELEAAQARDRRQLGE